MIHHLCTHCVHHCKQDESVKIMQCPKFQKRLSDDEFKDLIEQLKEMEADVANLKKRTEALIETALAHSGPVGDEEFDDDDSDFEDDEDGSERV